MITYVELMKEIHKLLNSNLEIDYMKRVDLLLRGYEKLIKGGISYSKTFDATTTIYEVQYGDVVNKLNSVNKIIPQILRDYLNGRIVKSISSLQNFLELSNFQTITINPKYVYYRARESKDTVLKKREEMFHVPFTHRGNVTNKRYSISGHPCLYLCRSLYTCWEELRQPQIENVYASIFKSNSKIPLLDLRMYKQFYTSDAFQLYIELFPIILICSMPTRKDSDTYKPEYILPQLLLHTATFAENSSSNSNAYRGIIYSSTHINFQTRFFASPQDYCLTDCIVIPARNSLPTRFCSYLTTRFELSNPINLGAEILYNRNLASFTNPVGNSKHQEYQASFFFVLEKVLQEKGCYKTITSSNDE